MDIAHLRHLMSKHGVRAEDFDELSRLAHDLPESNIEVVIPTLNAIESATLVSRLLHQLAPDVGAVFEHPDVLQQANFAVKEPARQQERVAEEYDHYANGSAA